MNRLVLSIIVGFSLMSLSGCASMGKNDQEAVEISAENLPVTVTISTVTTRKVAEEIRCDGTIVSLRKKIISAPVAGRISLLTLQPGAVISPGELLFQLDTTFLSIALQEALLEKEEALIRMAEKLASRPGPDTLQEEVLARWEILCGIPQSEQKIRRARTELRGATGRAKGAGRAGSIFVSEGQSVSAGEKIAEYHPAESFEVELTLPRLPSALAPGMEVRIQLFPDSPSLPGSIQHILPQVNEKGLFVAYVKLHQIDQQLYQGQRVTGILLENLNEEFPVVPEEALTTRSGRSVVFRIRKNVADWAYVKTGRKVAGYVQILNGVSVGDTIATSGQQYLGHGSQITFETRSDD